MESKPVVKISDMKDSSIEDWRFSPFDYGFHLSCGGKMIEFGFNSDLDFINNLLYGLKRMKLILENKEPSCPSKENNMDAREKLQKLADESNVSTKFVMGMFDIMIEAVKEDLATPGKEFDHLWEGAYEIPPTKPCPNCDRDKIGKLILVDHIGANAKCVKCGKKVPYPQNPQAEPETTLELIQGYTAEQWQEIIDGGYLCEGYAQNNIWVPVKLKKFEEGPAANAFLGEDGFYYSCFRPAQIKGVMRPIFVEPVGKDVWCSFFGEYSHLGDERWCVREHTCHFPTATRYIEIQKP